MVLLKSKKKETIAMTSCLELLTDVALFHTTPIGYFDLSIQNIYIRCSVLTPARKTKQI